MLPDVRRRGNRTVVPAADVRALAQRDTVDLGALGGAELPVLRVGPAAVTVGPYVVAVLTGFRGAESDGTGRHRFSARLAGFTSDLVTPVQVVRADVPGADEARRLLGRRLDLESGGPVAFVRSGGKASGGR